MDTNRCIVCHHPDNVVLTILFAGGQSVLEIVARDPVAARPPTWLMGSDVGIQVWTVSVHRAISATVLIGDDPPLILLNRAIIDTPQEGSALCQAMALIARGVRGFYPILCGFV